MKRFLNSGGVKQYSRDGSCYIKRRELTAEGGYFINQERLTFLDTLPTVDLPTMLNNKYFPLLLVLAFVDSYMLGIVSMLIITYEEIKCTNMN
jgi:hypothetical protein